jgi:hypothetical protein
MAATETTFVILCSQIRTTVTQAYFVNVLMGISVLHFLPGKLHVHLKMCEHGNGLSAPTRRAGRSRISPERWEQIKTAYASGLGLREIARSMHVSENTVLSRAHREGWSGQVNDAKALAKRDDTAKAITPFEAASASMQKRGERHVERMAGISERGVDHTETMDGPEILNSVDQIEKLDKVARRTFGLKDDNPYIGLDLNVLKHQRIRR